MVPPLTGSRGPDPLEICALLACLRSAAAHLVDGNGEREHQRLVLAARDLDAVGVAHAEPLLGDLRDDVAVALDLVLVLDEVAAGLQVVAVLDLDVVPVADPDERLVDRRQRVARRARSSSCRGR